MIRDRWYAILDSSEVRRGLPVGVTRLGEKLVLWRTARGEVACLADLCVHRGAALSAGCLAGDHVECPFHGFQYDPEGRCQHIPAIGRASAIDDRFRVRSYPARDAHGFIWIWWGDAPEALPELPWFDDLDDSFYHSQFIDPWPMHYSRAIENQLDVVHLPFVHRTTIGRGNRALVEGPIVEREGDRLRFYVFNRVDDGTPPRKAEELRKEDSPVHLDFHFPNVWQNWIAEKVRVAIAFVPVDEENTRVYMRYYHKVVPVPGIAHLVAWLGKLFSIVILRQDKRVVVTQRPIRSDLKMGEQLVPGDRPITEYRMHRQRLLDAQQPPERTQQERLAEGEGPSGPPEDEA